MLAGSFYAQSAGQYGEGSPRSHLGLGLTNINGDRANALKLGEPRGVEVRSVEEDGPAEKAGIEVGDVLLSYNGEEILSTPQIGRLVGETPPGRKVKMGYWRSGKAYSAYVKTVAAATQAPQPPYARPLDGMPVWNVPDFPRMLMLWDNVALGIECEPINTQLAEYFGVQNGILIRHVEKGFPADTAGLKAGDVILSVDTRSMSAPRDFISYLRTQRQPGTTLLMSIVRNRKSHSISIPLSQ